MRNWLYILIAILLLPALLINLGVMVFIDDEGIRALVAQEMLWSGNFVAPTLHGDAYLNKPPLWNWILAASFSIFGSANEWTARFPTVLALLGFAATTYAFSREILGRKLAFIHALTVVTCGRMLFWDSMLALIDVCFSWVIYSQILVLYYYSKRQQWWRAFGWAYLLTAIAFLLKGLPAIAFMGLTTIALVLWRKQWWQLFRPAHLISGLGCLAILGIYYWQLSAYVDLTVVGQKIFSESGKRTATNFELLDAVQHLAAFPFEMAYHFLPWTLLLIYFLQKGSWRLLKENDGAAFMLIAFLVNLPLYWLSPNIYPRYLLMLFPLLFGSGLYLHGQHALKNTLSFRIFTNICLALMVVVSIGFFLIPLIPETEIISFRWGWAILAGVLGFRLTQVHGLAPHKTGRIPLSRFMGQPGKQQYLVIFTAFLLLLRLVFNLYVLPPRAQGDERGQTLRQSAEQLANNYLANDQLLAVYAHSIMEPATSFYLERTYGKPIPRHFEKFDFCSTHYITNPWQYRKAIAAGIQQDSLFKRHQPNNPYYPVLDLCAGQSQADPQEYTDDLLDGMGMNIPIAPQ